jgi:hypothetical protein
MARGIGGPLVGELEKHAVILRDPPREVNGQFLIAFNPD